MKKTCTGLMVMILLSGIIVSCEKESFPGSESISSASHETGDARIMLPNIVITEWNEIAWLAAGGVAEGHPLLASRAETMMHIAIHDAINTIIPVYERYAYTKKLLHPANPLAAAVSAAHTVLKALWPDSASMLDARLASSLSTIADFPGKKQGIALGINAGKAILALRANDGAYQDPVSAWPDSDVPGVYIKVPPYDFVFAPFWATMQPFSLKTNQQFRVSPQPNLNSNIYTKDLTEVKYFGKINSQIRTAEQTASAYFWYEFADIGWNRIARNEASGSNMGLYAAARMFALLNMAIQDGYIAGWDSKFFYKAWRPYTAIRSAAMDGNDKTEPDLNWESLMLTPPIPDYPSTHSVVGSAAATVLTYFFGNDHAFSATSTSALPESTARNFKSFKQAADENADSRVMAGIHFRFSCKAGLQQGNQVAQWTMDNYLKPLY